MSSFKYNAALPVKCFSKFFFLVVLITYTSFLSAQHIKGNITNPTSDRYVYFRYYSGLTLIDDSAAVNKTGLFHKSFPFKEGKYLSLFYGPFRADIYIFPARQFNIAFDASTDSAFKSSFAVAGDLNINKYLKVIGTEQLHYKYVTDRVQIAQPIDSFKRVLAEFRHFADSLRTAYFAFLTVKPAALQSFLRLDSLNWYAYSILSACDYLRIIRTGNRRQFWQEEVANRLAIKHSDRYMASFFYRRMWRFGIRSAFDMALTSSDSTNVQNHGYSAFTLKYIEEHNLKGFLKEWIVSQLLYDILVPYSNRTADQRRLDDASIIRLKNLITDSIFLAQFDSEYTAKKRTFLNFVKGTSAPDFELIDTAGKPIHLKDLHGQVLLIDVWASWCGPCIREFPYLRELESKLAHEKNFMLLSVSVDETKVAWIRNGIEKFQPPGVKLWAGQENKFSKDYNIDLIPALILLDADGRFVEFNPPRASDGDKLYNLITETLAE